MKETITALLQTALQALQDEGVIDAIPAIQLSRARDSRFGDFNSNIAMVLAKSAGMAPRDLAARIIAQLPADSAIEKTEIAGPGFINFYLAADAGHALIGQILDAGEQYGRSNAGGGQRVQIEFVSANPTGPLHVGHGRGAAYGATLASLLRAVGYEVDCEYYVNDAGRQMNILAVSIWLRYLQSFGIDLPFPANGYKSEAYIYDIAASLKAEHGERFVHDAKAVMQGLPPDEAEGGDKEKHIDALIERARRLLGEDYQQVLDTGLAAIVADIRDDLEQFGVVFDNWFSERSLVADGLIAQAIDTLRRQGHIEERDGTLWFLSSRLGDEKDRVVVRDNGQPTYFASDIAYHLNKFQRGYDRLINIWGADHHGYVARVKAAIGALGEDPQRLSILLVQFANLYRNGERVPMSTRSGSFVTLRELREEVGNDAARFFYVMRKCEQHMDFDLDLAKSQSNDNPVYYIQYAHARICSVMRQLAEKQLQWDREQGMASLDRLNEPHESELIAKLAAWPDVLDKAAREAEPHRVAHYLRELANLLHAYYNAHPFIIDDSALRNARLNLINATRQVLHNGLSLLGVSAPEKM